MLFATQTRCVWGDLDPSFLLGCKWLTAEAIQCASDLQTWGSPD